MSGGWALKVAGRALTQAAAFLSLGSGAAAAANRIEMPSHRLWHVLIRHFPGGSESAGKSLFLIGEEVVSLVRLGERIQPVLQRGGNYQRIVDAGRSIGFDRATGQLTSVYTIITNPANQLVTMFPGVP
jgi:hypothetical protein